MERVKSGLLDFFFSFGGVEALFTGSAFLGSDNGDLFGDSGFFEPRSLLVK